LNNSPGEGSIYSGDDMYENKYKNRSPEVEEMMLLDDDDAR